MDYSIVELPTITYKEELLTNMEALDKKLFEKNDNLRAEKVMPKLKNSMLSGNSKLNFQLILDQITYELCV